MHCAGAICRLTGPLADASNDGEKWERIDGWPSYWISDEGRIWSEHTEQMLSPYTNESDTYEVVELYRAEGTPRSKQMYVHSLVANEFLRDRQQNEEVDHVNGQPTDNRAENLQWVSFENHATEAQGGPEETSEALKPSNDPAPF